MSQEEVNKLLDLWDTVIYFGVNELTEDQFNQLSDLLFKNKHSKLSIKLGV